MSAALPVYYLSAIFKMKNMQSITVIFLVVLTFGCTGTKNAALRNKLNGTWIPVQQELGGKFLPRGAFEKQKLILNDGSYTLIAESVDKGVVTYKDGRMDIYGKQGVNSGKHFTAIYKYENEQLTICYNLAGTHYPEAFETKGKPLYFLSVFKKE
jgi:uncharacterized protein (TIGR03067 family)